MDIRDIDQSVMIQGMINKGLIKESEHPVIRTEDGNSIKLSPAKIYYITCECAKNMGLVLENEPLYYIMNDSRALLVSARAGSGKTTTTVFKVQKSISLGGENPKKMCVLSFSVASVRDVKEKFKEIIYKFNTVTKRFGIVKGMSDMPNIRSLNSLTYNILDQYKSKFGINKVNIVRGEKTYELAKKVLNNFSYDRNVAVSDSMIEMITRIHDMLNEGMQSIDELEESYLTLEFGLPLQDIKYLIRNYRNTLKLNGVMHDSDTCRLIVEKCDSDLEFRKEIENIYSTIIIDEAQDISMSVYRLLLYMINTKNKCRIIGDDDQRIYGFKGALSDGCEHFKKDIKDLEMCKLSLNRRCSNNIIDYAREVINCIEGRPDLEVYSNRDVNILPNIYRYENKKDVLEKIISELPKDPEKMSEICICYRKNISCFYLVNKLLENGIPFKIKDDFMPGSDLLSRSLNGILDMLKSPGNMRYAGANLYKICGIKKRTSDLELASEVLNTKKKIKKSEFNDEEIYKDYLDNIMDEEDLEYFYEIPTKYFEAKNSKINLEEEFKVIESLSRRVKKQENLATIIPDLLKLFKKNYWNFIRTVKNFPEDLEDVIIEDFSREMSFIEFKLMRGRQEEAIKRYTSRGMGVQLSTFHSLKGLEYETVHIIELEKSMFPSIKVSENTSDKELTKLINDELRLFYVAVTRAKDNLNLYWSKTEPSSFKFINDNYFKKYGYKEKNLNITGDITLANDIMTVDLKPEEEETLDLNLDLTEELHDNEELSLELDLSLESSQSEGEQIRTLESISSGVDTNEYLESQSNEVELKDSLESITSKVGMTESLELNSLPEEKESEECIKGKVKESLELEEVSTLVSTNETKTDGEELEEYIAESSNDDLLHYEDDFKDIPAGGELQAILNMIVKEIII